MIDWHSHILPEMDDGSRSVSESAELLHLLFSQGADTVIATPHFYADNESAESFFERREASYEALSGELSADLPRIMLGAEVRYYQGISRFSLLENMRIEGSKLLLLEMPESKWSEYTVKEIEEISCTSQTRLILAHVERCLPFQSIDTLHRLSDCGVMMQLNADSFCEVFSRARALRLVGEGRVAFIGSDCHGIKRRPPMLDRAYQVIKRRFGEDFVRQMQEYGYSVLDLK